MLKLLSAENKYFPSVVPVKPAVYAQVRRWETGIDHLCHSRRF
jgi:hypothetical protein